MTYNQIATLTAALEVKRNTDAHVARLLAEGRRAGIVTEIYGAEQKRANERYYTLAAKAPPDLVAAIEACLEAE